MNKSHSANSRGVWRNKLATAFVAFGFAVSASQVNAAGFDIELPYIGEISGGVENLFSVGAMWRMQDPDLSTIGKSNVQPGLCVDRAGTNASGEPTFADDGNGIGVTCNSTSDFTLNQRYVAAPGSFSPNGDNGNMNFAKHDLTSANFKMTTDVNFSWRDFNFFVRGIYFFDEVGVGFNETHFDTTLQPSSTPTNAAYESNHGTDFDVLDYHVTTFIPFGEREITLRVGNQGINWGESSFLLLNSLNAINPPDATRLVLPGFDVKELFTPVGMVWASTDLNDFTTIEAFYNYQWKPLGIPAIGSFFSPSDILGPGEAYAMLSFGKAPEDPKNAYQSRNNANDSAGLSGQGVDAGRTVYRDRAREAALEPDGQGQYGVALKYFAENFNNGTEFAFYHSNYHSRTPTVSLIAAQTPSCTRGGPNGQQTALTNCPAAPVGSPLPVDASNLLTVDDIALVVSYPEDIQLYGFSFNTTVGDWALSGEIAHRENLPVQIHSTDLTYAALQPAFPSEDLQVGNVVIPGARSAVPDFIETRYRRGITDDSDTTNAGRISPGDFIQGWEDMQVTQVGTTFLKTIGGDNMLNASQIIVLLELGMTYVWDMPGKDVLQFNGPGANTHASHGQDATSGLYSDPNQLGQPCQDNAHDGDAPSGTRAAGATHDGAGCRQNPTAQNPENFGDQTSWGYRFISLLRYQNAFMGWNLEPLIGFFHDVNGNSPGIGMNHTQGRQQILMGLRGDYLSKWSGEVRWTVQRGDFNGARDRDNLMATMRYSF